MFLFSFKNRFKTKEKKYKQACILKSQTKEIGGNVQYRLRKFDYDFRLQFLCLPSFQSALIHIDVETKRSCKLIASLCLFVNLYFVEKSLIEIKTEKEKSYSLFEYKHRPLQFLSNRVGIILYKFMRFLFCEFWTTCNYTKWPEKSTEDLSVSYDLYYPLPPNDKLSNLSIFNYLTLHKS